ncbi:hypothetical protein CHS0354_035455 [Potamilus streckersoni]|uniref:Uncharacterized protein n=1 Tax=Potamilus streckersoni TaxID=2493646 RepID=A0AAE0TDL0_9BIVA|nr:hypothetical protein CHS0354_035455 [Potamilus streckersoni]
MDIFNRLKKRDPKFGSPETIPVALNKRKKVVSSSMDDIIKYVENENDGNDTVTNNDTASSDSESEESEELNRASKRQKLFARKTIKREKKREKELRKRIEKNKISMDDFWSKQSEFKMWLVEEKCKSACNMTSPKLKAHFKNFVRAWNKKKLPDKYYRGSSTFCNSPSVNKKYKILEDEENQPLSILSCDNNVGQNKMDHIKESPFITFGKTPSKVFKSKKEIFGSTSDVALISIAPIESPILYKRSVSSKEDNQYFRPDQKNDCQASNPDGHGARVETSASQIYNRPAKPIPYKVSVYPWAVDPTNSADQNLELCSISTPPGGILTKISNLGIEKKSERVKKSLLEGNKPKSGTVIMDSPPLPPPPPPLRSDLLIINDSDYLPPPPELGLSKNYADPYDSIPKSCKGRLLIQNPDSEYHEPMDTLNKHGTQGFETGTISSQWNSSNLPSKPYELSTFGEKPAGYKTLASQIFDFDKNKYMLGKNIGEEIMAEENVENFLRKKKRGIIAASSNKIYETYLNLKRNQNPFVSKPEKLAQINEKSYKRPLKRRSLSQPDLSSIFIHSEPSDNAKDEELQWGTSKQSLLGIKLETARAEKIELLPIKQAFESSVSCENIITAVTGDFNRPCQGNYMGGPNYIHKSVQKSLELRSCLSSDEDVAMNESDLPVLTEAENSSGLKSLNHASDRQGAKSKWDSSGLSQTLFSNDSKKVYAAGGAGLSTEIEKVISQGTCIKWDSSGSLESLFSNDSKKADADRGSGSSGEIKKVATSQSLTSIPHKLKYCDRFGTESMCTFSQGLYFPGNDLEKEILSSESDDRKCIIIYDKTDSLVPVSSNKQTLPSIIVDHNRQKTTEFSEDDLNTNIHELEEQSSSTPDIVSSGFTTFKPASTPGWRQSAVHGVDFSAYLLKQPLNQNAGQNNDSKLSVDQDHRCQTGLQDEGNIDGQSKSENSQHQTGQKHPQEIVNEMAAKSDIPKDSSFCKSTKQVTHLNKSSSDRAPIKKPALGVQTATAKVLKQNPKLLINAQKKRQKTARQNKSKSLAGKVLETDIDEAVRETKRKMQRSKSESRIGEGTLRASSVVTEIW